jgi:IPT/TIG domain-containing protein
MRRLLAISACCGVLMCGLISASAEAQTEPGGKASPVSAGAQTEPGGKGAPNPSPVAPPPVGPSGGHTGLVVFYAVAILAFPFLLMFVDLWKAYRFAHSTRTLIIGRAAADGLTSEELRLLLTELSQSPPGIPGLARNSIAFMLMMILGVAIVHILAVDPGGLKEIPASIDRILVLLTGLLTSVVSFYFGTRAAETAQQGARMSQSDPVPKLTPITFQPKSGKPGDPVKISGTGFGTERGTVLFGDVAADMTTAQWVDREITVRIPEGVKPGRVPVAVIPKGTDRRMVASVELEIASATSGGASAGSEHGLDGCGTAITEPTLDESLPAAGGGVGR